MWHIVRSQSRLSKQWVRSKECLVVGYEVDFLHVGDGERSGDAICLRFGDLEGTRAGQFVMVIDGGTRDSGQRLVKHINDYYGTNRVNLVVSTHSDNDHISGLRLVVEQMDVDRLWMHRPWQHSEDFRSLFKSRTITTLGLKRSIRAALDTAVELEELAIKKGIQIDEPFSDADLPFADLGIRVLGPSRGYYEELLPQFRGTPDAASEAAPRGIFHRAGTAVAEAVKAVAEDWGFETLADPEDDATSAENNSSVVLTIEHDGRRMLFTGDAGVPALTRAADIADSLGIDLPSSRFVQVPHHGSRRNVGPTILTRLLGPKGQEQNKTAYVSCAKDDAKHPSKKVCNAFQRRGARDKVFSTDGQTKHHHHDAPDRGWSAATPLPFYDDVEE